MLRRALASLVLLLATTAAAQSVPTYSGSVVVTAAGEEQSAEEVSAAATVIAAEELRASGIVSVADALRRVPGTQLLRSGGDTGVASLFVRGTNSAQTLVLFDGVRLNSPYFGGYDWSLPMTAGLDRVEVVRGPYSALYGADAVGGVVHMIPAGEEGTRLRAFLEGGADGWQRGEVEASVRAGACDALVTAASREGSGTLDIDDFPAAAAAEIGRHAQKASLERAKVIEAEISHDMMAMVKAISEVCGESGRWVHYGATSNDILDTATGLQLLQALNLIDEKLRRLLGVLLKRADETKSLVCIGRTHGQHGVPTTYGLRFAIWASEVGRHIESLGQLRPRVVVGQMTGAVGTQAALGPKAMEVQATMMGILGIGSVDVSKQVISRDRYAEYFMFCAGVATTLDKIGIEIRFATSWLSY